MTGNSGPRSLVVLLTARATSELLAAVTWWRKNRLEAPRLPDGEIERALRRMAVFPLELSARDARHLALRRSGYLLFHRVRPSLGRIEVISVWNARRG